ncbi:hypothetical protein CLF_110479 [Clonorchis sinensis]|uniref:Uncharacterized protein n=1 Tax=Clonorchis sinensis TaxID=79923 RepID=G7YKS0_CLOSI|nr:hypothetical protein CLF_110479 [Clonorchis sinensis]
MIDAKKDLGIWLSPNLSFSLHLEKSAQKALAVLRIIRRTFSRIARTDFQILYGAYVRPLLEYANPVVYSGRTNDYRLLRGDLILTYALFGQGLANRFLTVDPANTNDPERIRCSTDDSTHLLSYCPHRLPNTLWVYVRPLRECANPVVYSGRTKDVTLIELVQCAATKTIAGLKSMDC